MKTQTHTVSSCCSYVNTDIYFSPLFIISPVHSDILAFLRLQHVHSNTSTAFHSGTAKYTQTKNNITKTTPAQSMQKNKHIHIKINCSTGENNTATSTCWVGDDN